MEKHLAEMGVMVNSLWQCSPSHTNMPREWGHPTLLVSPPPLSPHWSPPQNTTEGDELVSPTQGQDTHCKEQRFLRRHLAAQQARTHEPQPRTELAQMRSFTHPSFTLPLPIWLWAVQIQQVWDGTCPHTPMGSPGATE